MGFLRGTPRRNSWMVRTTRAIRHARTLAPPPVKRTHTQAHVLSPPKRGGTRAPSRCGLRSLPIRHGGALTVSCPVWLHSPGVLLSLTHLLQGYGEAARRAWHPSPSGCAQGTTILHRVCPAARERRVGEGGGREHVCGDWRITVHLCDTTDHVAVQGYTAATRPRGWQVEYTRTRDHSRKKRCAGGGVAPAEGVSQAWREADMLQRCHQ